MTTLALIALTLLTLADLPPRHISQHERTRMSQEFQSIGSASSALDAVADQHQGWPDDTVRPQIEEYTENGDFSFHDRRANSQALGRSVPNMAAHTETSAAAQPVRPYDPFQPGAGGS
jgi:hypothetical protein